MYVNKPYNPKRSRLEGWGRRQMSKGNYESVNTYSRNLFILRFQAIKGGVQYAVGANAAAVGWLGRKAGLLSRMEKNKRISEGLKKSSNFKNRRKR